MYFEIFKSGKLVKRGKDLLGDISWSIELMDIPETTLLLPISYLEYLSGREEIKLHINDKIFWGAVTDIQADKSAETIEVELCHIVKEWEYRQISVNHAIKDQNLNVVFKGSETGKNNGQSISANPFNLYSSEVGKLSNAKIIARAGASAWDSTGEKVDIASVDTSKLKTDSGDYEVTFKTAKGASVTVKATVKSDPKKGEKDEIEDKVNVDASIIDQLSDIYADTNFAYDGWRMDYFNGASGRVIDYVYSRQNKLEALTKTMELTEDLFWRVDFLGEKHIEVGAFGEIKPYIVSTKPRGERNIPLVQEPTLDYDFDNVINIATVYSEKSDSGMSSMTLREVYNDESLQIDGFPVVILRSNVNNERDYSSYVSTTVKKIAPNNELEYAVIDEASVAIETVLLEGTFAFTDLQPFALDGKTVSDADRIKAARTAYRSAVKKLKQARRSYQIEVVTEQLPPTIKVGDRVRFIYDNKIYNLDACSNYWKKILTYDDYFYITRIDYDISVGGSEIDTLTLEKFIKVDRETDNQ